ncbi:MAG: hypothetical protein LC772_06805 [Chloroflexi bacterium]|nr:hypothetical protein [Chloroflexota bacterium]
MITSVVGCQDRHDRFDAIRRRRAMARRLLDDLLAHPADTVLWHDRVTALTSRVQHLDNVLLGMRMEARR